MDINVYILCEETIPELSEKTGLSERVFEDMLGNDRSFNLVSKIYLIPEKAVE